MSSKKISLEGIVPDNSWMEPITVQEIETVAPDCLSTGANASSCTDDEEKEKECIIEVDGKQKKTPIPFLFSKSKQMIPIDENDSDSDNDNDNNEEGSSHDGQEKQTSEAGDNESRSSFNVSPVASVRSVMATTSQTSNEDVLTDPEGYQKREAQDLSREVAVVDQKDVLFRTYAVTGSTNNASPKDYHKIVWDLSEGEDKNTNLDGMEGVFHEKVVATDAFVAPKSATYNVWVFANWRAAKMEDGVEVPHPVAADIYIEIVDSQNNWKKRFDDKHQIGRGTGGGAYKMDEGDTLYVYLYNPHPQKIQVMSEKTFLNVTTGSASP